VVRTLHVSLQHLDNRVLTVNKASIIVIERVGCVPENPGKSDGKENSFIHCCTKMKFWNVQLKQQINNRLHDKSFWYMTYYMYFPFAPAYTTHNIHRMSSAQEFLKCWLVLFHFDHDIVNVNKLTSDGHVFELVL
jgi:hypothetical protein